MWKLEMNKQINHYVLHDGIYIECDSPESAVYLKDMLDYQSLYYNDKLNGNTTELDYSDIACDSYYNITD